jgi:hypothetical protein
MAPLTIVALGVAAGFWYQAQTFAITRTASIELGGPTTGGDAATSHELREMHVRCDANGDHYVSDSGDMLFWGAESPAPAKPICDDARSERRRVSVGIGLVGVLAALGLLLYRRVAVNLEKSSDSSRDVQVR